MVLHLNGDTGDQRGAPLLTRGETSKRRGGWNAFFDDPPIIPTARGLCRGFHSWRESAQPR